MEKQTIARIGICILVIIFVAIAGINGHKKGYDKGLQELEDFKKEYHVFHDEWNRTRSGAYSEYLKYKSSVFDAYKKDNWFYLLRFNNYVKADEGWEIYVNLERNLCNLRVMNRTCFSEWGEGDIENANCTKEYTLQGGDLNSSHK